MLASIIQVCVKLCSKETPRSYLWTCDMLSIQAGAWGHHTNACEAMCDGGGQGWSPWCTCNQKWPFLQFLFHPKGQAVAGWSQVCAVGLNSIVSDSSPRSYLAMTEHFFCNQRYAALSCPSSVYLAGRIPKATSWHGSSRHWCLPAWLRLCRCTFPAFFLSDNSWPCFLFFTPVVLWHIGMCSLNVDITFSFSLIT